MIGDRYRLREPLGSGGMSVVWRAADELLGREVAVKVLSAGVSADPAALRRMYGEARAAAGLRHDNVVEVYDYGETDIDGVPMPYVVMELVDGRPLSDLLGGGALSWRLAVLIGAQVAAALAAAHDRGVVHRDVKPANVMVTAGGVKLVDFGISAAVGDLELVSDQILGTPAYLAPERMGGGMVRPATDVYALGLLLYLMLAGRMPWNASTTTQMLRAHRYQEPAPLPPVPGLPAEITDLVRTCLAKAPSDRPAAVAAARALRQAAGLPPLSLLAGLEDRAAAAGTPTEPVTAATAPGPARRTIRTRIAAVPARHRVVAVGGVLLLAAGFLLWPSTSERQPAAVAATTPLTCRVTYKTQVAAGGRAVTAVSVANTGAAPIDGWTLAFRLPGGQKLVRGSEATWKQSGEVVRATGRTLGPGAATKASFDTTYRTTVVLPQSFTVNDVVCGAEMSVLSSATTTTKAATTKAAATTPSARPSPATPVVRTKTRTRQVSPRPKTFDRPTVKKHKGPKKKPPGHRGKGHR